MARNKRNTEREALASISHEFSWDNPLNINGVKYPSTMMNIEGKEQQVFATPQGNVYALDNSGKPQSVMYVHNLDTVPISAWRITPEERRRNITRQSLMGLSGYNVPHDGTWNDEQEEIWNNLTNLPKVYDTTFKGLYQGITDKLTGNDYYQTDPTYSGDIHEYDPKAISYSETARMNNPVLKTLNETYIPAALALYGPKGVSKAAETFFASPYSTLGSMAFGSLYGSLGDKAVDNISKELTDKDWSENVQQYTGLNPTLSSFTNPGGFFGGYVGAHRGMNLERRGIETVMRSSNGVINPTGVIHHIQKTTKEQPKRALDILGYIYTGLSRKNAKQLGKGYYKSWAPNYNASYDGTIRQMSGIMKEKVKNANDIIDALLYKKDIDPVYGLKKMDTKDYGIHSDYIAEKYPQKDIPVYEQEMPHDYSIYQDLHPGIKWERYGNPEGSESLSDFYSDLNPGLGIDVGGHLNQYYKREVPDVWLPNEKNTVYGKNSQDIWKFNPEEYMKKWVGNPFNYTDLRRAVLKFGLSEVDKLGTPVITRMPIHRISSSSLPKNIVQ